MCDLLEVFQTFLPIIPLCSPPLSTQFISQKSTNPQLCDPNTSDQFGRLSEPTAFRQFSFLVALQNNTCLFTSSGLTL